MAWTERMDAILRHERSEGKSFSQAAARISFETGVHVTRNAAISRAGRIGLPVQSKAPSISRSKARRLRRNRAAATAPVKTLPTFETVHIPDVREDDIPTKTFAELENNHCQHRIDVSYRGEPYGFCGKKTLIGLRCCAQHAPRWYDNWAQVKHLHPEVKTKRKEKEPA